MRLQQCDGLILDPQRTARAAGLRYICDDSPGFTRCRRGKGFVILDERRRPVNCERTLHRIRSLAIPPAWEKVWICPNENGHLQATGRDARGRKQYRYHPIWQQFRNETKFDRMVRFGALLPGVRERVDHDLARAGLPREKVLATVVALLECSLIRIGNSEYARENQHYGLTTIQNRHVQINGADILFRFKGKSGIDRAVTVRDRRLARIVRSCQELPGQELFAYLDEFGQTVDIESGHINDYLRETTGEVISAKDFRTWHGTVHAAMFLWQCGPCSTKRDLQSALKAAADSTSSFLGNTPAVCRKYYIHPIVTRGYEEGRLLLHFNKRASRYSRLERTRNGLEPHEHLVWDYLKSVE